MTGYELKLWRRGMNWTQERARRRIWDIVGYI
ncbi:Uncharacterised protein [Escherichia coli]|uniref:Uncharacterized protein n=1 Tax=Escherichia coli TaxID=562 RepID=A0A2X1LW09_ECOLX|nr:Uncharacterised protein [Escherichia coli]